MKKPITPAIFSDKVFGDTEKFMDHLQKKQSSKDIELDVGYNEPEYVTDISIFDYIMAQRLDIVPFRSEAVYYDWCGYVAVSVPTIRKFIKFCCTHDARQLINSVPVHQNLFYDISLDLTDFFVALFIQPQPYRVCCMQWDSYEELYSAYRGKTERRKTERDYVENRLGRIDNSYSRQNACAEWMSSVETTGTRLLHFLNAFPDSHTNPYDNSVIHPIYLGGKKPFGDDCRKNPKCYSMFTSDCGKLDAFEDKARGNYCMDRETWISTAIGLLNSASYPELKTSETFFSDLFSI